MNIHVTARIFVGPLIVLLGTAMWIWGPGVVATASASIVNDDLLLGILARFSEVASRVVALGVGLLGCVLTIREL